MNSEPPTAAIQRYLDALLGDASAERLPGENREVFELVRFQGLIHGEAAGVVGTSVKSVQRRLNRARLLWAAEVGDICPGGSLQTPGDTPTP
ncbi:MAG: RNA polymerase sigma factor [Pirellulaceae bacterium]